MQTCVLLAVVSLVLSHLVARIVFLLASAVTVVVVLAVLLVSRVVVVVVVLAVAVSEWVVWI